jgi:hypothetical protein
MYVHDVCRQRDENANARILEERIVNIPSSVKKVILGYSGHLWLLKRLWKWFKIIGYSDKEKSNSDPHNLSYLGFEKNDDFVGWQKEASFVLE